jgi:transposase
MDVKIPCPHCHKTFSVPLAQIAPGASRPCPECGAQIKFAGSDASKVQSILDQLGNVPGVKVNVTVRQKSKPWWKFWA